jgi:hypothetical protein
MDSTQTDEGAHRPMPQGATDTWRRRAVLVLAGVAIFALGFGAGRLPLGDEPGGEPQTADAGETAVAGEAAPTEIGSPAVTDCEVFPPDNAWNTDISGLPVHEKSDAWVSSLGGDGLHADFGTQWEGEPIGIPYVIVGGDQARVPISFEYDDESDPGPYPIPPDATIEGGTDDHIIVVDDTNCMVYEVFEASTEDGGSSWHAGSGAVFDLSRNDLRPDMWTSADAAGLPIFPGLVKYEEVEAGEVNHALRFTLEETQRAFMHPATHYASDDTDEDLPPMGARFRLRADFDCSGLSDEIQVVCDALKRYGMFLADNGGDRYVSGTTDERWDDEALSDLAEIPGSAFEVVDTGEAIVRGS